MNDVGLCIFCIICIIVGIIYILYILYMGTEKKYVERFLKIFEDNYEKLCIEVDFLDYVINKTTYKNEIVKTDEFFKICEKNGILDKKILNSIIVHEALKVDEQQIPAILYYPLRPKLLSSTRRGRSSLIEDIFSIIEGIADLILRCIKERSFYAFKCSIEYVQETEVHYDMRTQGIHVNNSPGTQVIAGSNIQGPVQNNPVIYTENSQYLDYAIQLLNSSIDSYQDSGIQADDERRIASKILEILRSNKIPSERDETYIKDQIDRSPWLKKIVTEAMSKTLDKLAGATIPDAIDWLAGLVGIS